MKTKIEKFRSFDIYSKASKFEGVYLLDRSVRFSRKDINELKSAINSMWEKQGQ